VLQRNRQTTFPSKVAVFIWQLLLDYLTTKDTFMRWDIINEGNK